MENHQDIAQALASFAQERTDTVHSVECKLAPGLGDRSFIVRLCVGLDDNQIDVTIGMLDTGDVEDLMFDPDIRVSNNDWAGLGEMHRALGLAIEEFKKRGYDKACPELGLEKYVIVGM